jgi:hypothetical protein
MSHPPLYTFRMKNIIIDHKHTVTSVTPDQVLVSLTPCFSKVAQLLPDPSTVSAVSCNSIKSIQSIRSILPLRPPLRLCDKIPHSNGK